MAKFNKSKYLRKIKFKRYRKYFYGGFVGIVCFILGIFFTYSKFSISKDTEVVRTTVGDFIQGDIVIGAYINGEYSKEIPGKNSGFKVEKVVCNNEATGTWNNDSWGIVVANLSKRTKCNIYFSYASYDFTYTSKEQAFTVPATGTYKLEVWGAQGGSNNTDIQAYGGVGGYSVGLVKLNVNDTLYINVGGKGADDKTGGYNGGGAGGSTYSGSPYGNGAGGGGATHIATKSGLLSSLENYKSNILIVSGGGGGVNHCSTAGIGGGINGGVGLSSSGTDYSSNGGNQTSGYKFGLGQNGSSKTTGGNCKSEGNSGGGGGFYGGYSKQQDTNAAGGGGSGYIGNSLLSEKAMYCYNCTESNEENTKTIATTCTSETPTEKCSKEGNGYARITLISMDK